VEPLDLIWTVAIRLGLGKEDGRPVLGRNPAAPWLELAGVGQNSDLGH